MFAQRMQNLSRSFIRDILAVTQQPGIISFAGGLPDPALFPETALAQATTEAAENYGSALYQYGETAGVHELRNWISSHLSDTPVTSEQIIVTAGSQQALDLLVRVLINPGERVAVESPSYLGALQALSANEARLEAVESDEHGPIPEALEALLSEKSIKCFYSVPTFQNPTGLNYPMHRRKALSEVLEKHGCWLIEDAPYEALRYKGEALPSMQSLLPSQTVRLGSFSKIIAPGLRLGWISGPKEVIQQIEKLKQVTDLHTSSLSQFIALQFLMNGELPNHLERLKQSYGERLNCISAALQRDLPTATFQVPEGGMFIWVNLPQGMDSYELFEEAIKQRVAFVPGKAFYTDETKRSGMRLNFTNSGNERIEEGIKRLGTLLS